MMYYLHDSDWVRFSPPADLRVGLCTSTHGSASASCKWGWRSCKEFHLRTWVANSTFFWTCRMQCSIKWEVLLRMQAVFTLTGVFWSPAAWRLTCPFPCIMRCVWWWFPVESALILSLLPRSKTAMGWIPGLRPFWVEFACVLTRFSSVLVQSKNMHARRNLEIVPRCACDSQ